MQQRQSMNNKGVIYFLVGTKRCAVAVVSLLALRKFYDGPVCLMTTGDAVPKRIAEDSRLNLDLMVVPLENVKKHAVHVTKTSLYKHTPFQKTVFIDADTIPLNSFEEVWPIHDEMVFTQFSEWYSAGQKIRTRLRWWTDIVPNLVEEAILNNVPALNTGVFGFSRRSDMLEPWLGLCKAGAHTFIPDEISAQLLHTGFDHRLLDDRFNCSSKFGVNKDDVRIWHCHGKKHLEPNTSALWLLLFGECWNKNIGGVKEWLSKDEQKRYL